MVGAQVGQHGVAVPRIYIVCHRVRQRSAQAAPSQHLAQQQLIAARLIGAIAGSEGGFR
jgi:hypothetical protein